MALFQSLSQSLSVLFSVFSLLLQRYRVMALSQSLFVFPLFLQLYLDGLVSSLSVLFSVCPVLCLSSHFSFSCILWWPCLFPVCPVLCLSSPVLCLPTVLAVVSSHGLVSVSLSALSVGCWPQLPNHRSSTVGMLVIRCTVDVSVPSLKGAGPSAFLPTLFRPLFPTCVLQALQANGTETRRYTVLE